MIEFSRVPFVPQPDNIEGPGLDFRILSFSDSILSFHAPPSSGLGGVAVGRGAAAPSSGHFCFYPGLLRVGKKS